MCYEFAVCCDWLLNCLYAYRLLGCFYCLVDMCVEYLCFDLVIWFVLTLIGFVVACYESWWVMVDSLIDIDDC